METPVLSPIDILSSHRTGRDGIYQGQDTLLGRKMYQPPLQYPAARRCGRFRREQAARQPQPPNIVSIYDWGRRAHLFIVMERSKAAPSERS